MEPAASLGFKAAFGDGVDINYCWFHYRKALRQKAGELHILEELGQMSFNRLYRLLAVLPFLPSEDVTKVIPRIQKLIRCGGRWWCPCMTRLRRSCRQRRSPSSPTSPPPTWGSSTRGPAGGATHYLHPTIP